MDPSFYNDAFSFVTKVIHNMDIDYLQISCKLHKCFNISDAPNIDNDAAHAWQFYIHYKCSCIAIFVLQIGKMFLEFTAQKANFEILMPVVDNRHTTMCSVDGWGDRNTKYTFAPV